MIDLTPLDVRNKRGDFKKAMRGYEPHEVDLFLEMVADRLETVVRENLQLRERTETLQKQVAAQTDREQAVQDALVTAQALRADIRAQSQREADHVIREAEVESRRMVAEADEVVRERLRGIERQLDQASRSVEELERRRARFLTEFRGLLERELDVVHVEESRVPLEARAIDLDLGPASAPGSQKSASKGWDGAGRTDANASPGLVAEPPNAEAVSEASADRIIPAGVDPFFSSDLTPPAEDLVPLGGVSGSIAAGAVAAGIDAADADFGGVSTGPEEGVDGGQASSDPSLDVPAANTDTYASSVEERSETGAAGHERSPLVEPAPDPGARVASDLGVPMDVDALRPDMGASMLEPEVFASEAEAYHEQRYGPRVDPAALPVDVADLGPSTPETPEVQHMPPPPASGPVEAVRETSPLEAELMTRASSEGKRPIEDQDRFAGIPDLETVLAEAGVDDTPRTPEESAPPPVDTDDPVLLFDPDDDDPYRR